MLRRAGSQGVTLSEITRAIVGKPLTVARAWAEERGYTLRVCGGARSLEYAHKRINVRVAEDASRVVTEVECLG